MRMQDISTFFFTNFYISHENVIEIFLKNGQITNARASFNRIK